MTVTATVFDWIYHALQWTWHDPDGYSIISGPVADLTLLGGAYAILRRHNCHAKGCWRLGRHPVPGTDYIVCRKHHPHISPTAQDILDAHHAAVERGIVATHVAQAVVHGTEKAVHGAQTAVHDAENAVHGAETAVHGAETAVHGAETAVHAAEDVVRRVDPPDRSSSAGADDEGIGASRD